jgi:hypothetical protein
MSTAAAFIAVAALLTGGYVVAGQTGLAEMTAVAAAAVVLAVRGRLGAGTEYLPELPKRRDGDVPPGFASYTRIMSRLEWAVLSRRQYEHAIRPMLISLGAPEDSLPVPPPGGEDGPGPDLVAFDRVITMLEES